MNYRFFTTFLLICTTALSQKTSSEIYHDLQKAHSLKRVLYIAAHPDDENTKALAYFSLGELAETAYLSLTRGDGGQNLIGDELSEDLGVLRTQELLAARSIDGAKQYFSRAVDFGYSKSADESFEKWGKEELLSDVIRIIRQFKPDVIITRFPPDKRGGHGHHTASAMLAIEAFNKAADLNFLPKQVEEFGVWKTTSIYWNSSVWWDKELGETAKNNPDYLVKDIGGFNELLGKSYNEIGSLARSQHKCQGFGAIIERGSQTEYFMHLGGEKLKESFFEQNTATWSKLMSSDFENDFNSLLDHFDFVHLEKNVQPLIELRKKLVVIPKSYLSTLKEEKIALLDKVIINCLGLYIDITANDYAFAPNETIKISYNLVNRSSLSVQLNGIKNKEILVLLNQNENIVEAIEITNKADISNPYWLNEPFTALFNVENDTNLGKAESDPTYTENVKLLIEGNAISLNLPVIYKWRDPAFGERQRGIISCPNFTVNFDQTSVILKPGQEKKLKLKIHGFARNLNDHIRIKVPEGWEVSPNTIDIKTTDKHEEIWAEIKLKSSTNGKRGQLELNDTKGKSLKTFTEITYDHIPNQVIFKPAELTCIPLIADIKPGKIAYIKGAGDAVPQAIEQLGFELDLYEVSDLSTIQLNKYQSVVLGIRIYNIHPELHNFDSKLFAYVNQGGNLVMQYNTASRNPNGEKFGPSPFELSRIRVTEEDSKVTFLNPKHPIMNTPNKITQTDFNNWVQERGLYFASNYGSEYLPLFAWNDKDEAPQEGALIVAKHGKGQFIYTGISFFRELPNGVEGAYRLFANILSY